MERLSLSVEVMTVFDVVDLQDELFLDGITGMQALKRHTHHTLEVIVGLLDLTDVNGLQLNEIEFKGRI